MVSSHACRRGARRGNYRAIAAELDRPLLAELGMAATPTRDWRGRSWKRQGGLAGTRNGDKPTTNGPDKQIEQTDRTNKPNKQTEQTDGTNTWGRGVPATETARVAC